MATLHKPRYTLGIIDQTREIKEHSYYTADLTLLNFAASEAALLAIKAAEGGIIIGGFAKEVVEASRDIEDPLPVPADGNAQREMNWLVLLQDSVTFRRFTIRIAAPDMGTVALRVNNGDFADLTHANWVAYKTAVAAIAKSEAGNAVTVIAAKLVGKSDDGSVNAFKGAV